MKKGFVFLLMSMISVSSFSQGIRINSYGAYSFKDRIDSRYDFNDYYRGTIMDGFQFGGGLEFMADDDYGIELSYQRLNSSAEMYYYKDGNEENRWKFIWNTR
jgi:hypothetical protein